ncbi:3-deoxy-manno-octulosonate cytidylyltransferase, partial [Candidatus Woesearchaeota archaeon]|nr:3-deoxy-manno-octulosonate cytidylyltransferase [Candidatus Woesearchaeota archaeon]
MPGPPVCIPARWAASRLPGKLLLPWEGGTVLGRVLALAREAGLGPVRVLAGDARIEAGA